MGHNGHCGKAPSPSGRVRFGPKAEWHHIDARSDREENREASVRKLLAGAECRVVTWLPPGCYGTSACDPFSSIVDGEFHPRQTCCNAADHKGEQHRYQSDAVETFVV